ncbi:MAG: FAD-dependent oxidoreductase [Polyangiaceae bacterium]
MRRIGVVGGGLTGLAIAFRRGVAGDSVSVFESSTRFGGQLWTEHADGFVVEHGAEGFVARSQAVPGLAASLGIDSDLIVQSENRSYGFDGRRLQSLAPGEAAAFLGFQVARDDLGKGIRTFRRGMGQLAEALVQALTVVDRRGHTGPLATNRVALRPSSRVTTIAPSGRRWRMTVEGQPDEEFDAVVVATPAAVAASILGATFGEAARALAEAPTLSSCTVTLAYPRPAIDHPLDATGFVVAEAHQENGFRASTFITSKFPDRAPAGGVSLRLFFRPSDEDLTVMSDAAWTARAEASLSRVLLVRGRPLCSWVSRWSSALPVFDPAHVSRVQRVTAALAGTGVQIAGSAFHGAGIDASVRSAEAAARVY